jgi:hypothetical protein
MSRSAGFAYVGGDPPMIRINEIHGSRWMTLLWPVECDFVAFDIH